MTRYDEKYTDQSVASEIDAQIATARIKERARCIAIIDAEIQAVGRGLTSLVLHSVKREIENP
jgi:hypothetical protein